MLHLVRMILVRRTQCKGLKKTPRSTALHNFDQFAPADGGEKALKDLNNRGFENYTYPVHSPKARVQWNGLGYIVQQQGVKPSTNMLLTCIQMLCAVTNLKTFTKDH